jgi:hypothetical protein
VAAMGFSRRGRPEPHGDSHDAYSVIYEYADGLLHEHSGHAVWNGSDDQLTCKVYGTTAHAIVNYWRKSHFHCRGQEPAIDAVVENLYDAGAVRNIASFHRDIVGGRFENPAVRRAVDDCLTCILGREAGLRKRRLTMDELLRENKHVEADLRGLKT